MVDVILFLFMLMVFFAGFWAGKTFGTIKVAFARGAAWARSLLS